MGSVVVVKPHKTVALPFVVMAMLCVMSAVIVAVHIPMHCIYVIITVLLTFDAHALQGYSSWLCVCVRFDFSIQYGLAKKTYGSPQHCKRFN